MNWEQVLATIVPIITVTIGLFAWLRNDIKSLERRQGGRIENLENDLKEFNEWMAREVQRLDNRIVSESRRQDDQRKEELQGLRSEMNEGFIALEDRLRGVETEQARVAGLLEGLAFAGRLPEIPA